MVFDSVQFISGVCLDVEKFTEFLQKSDDYLC